MIKNFTRVNIEKSGNILVGWGGGRAVLHGGGLKARMGVGKIMPVSGYNKRAPSPFSPKPQPRRNSLFFMINGVAGKHYDVEID